MVVLQKMRINTRLSAGFIAVLALMGIGSLVGFWQLNRLEHVVERVTTVESHRLMLAEHWLRAISVNLERAKTALLLASDDEHLPDIRKEMDSTSTEISKYQKAIEGFDNGKGGNEILGRISVLRERYRAVRAGLVEKHSHGEDVRAELLRTMSQTADDYLTAVNDFVAWQQGELDGAREQARQAAQSGRLLIILAAVCGLCSGALVAFLISRSIVAPLRRASETALRISGGDLRGEIRGAGHDEAAEMLAAMGEMQANLRRIVEEVHASAANVAAAAAQIAMGNTDLSARTEKQAVNIEETAASLEELTSTVKQNAQSTREADELAASASTVANRGGEAVSQVIKTMEDIQSRSKKISEIIGMIDAIAFQTNILALNAAVEAARAGEHGRGFAVVASEVRSLAQRSASSARDIKEIISESMGTVMEGSRLAGEAGRTMQDVVQSVKRVSSLIGEISNATNEQSIGISQVNTAVIELEGVTQQNSALAEESTAAAESLRQQADRLAQSIAVFQFAHGHENEPSPAKALRAVTTSDTPVARPARPVLAARAGRLPVRREKQPRVDHGQEESWQEF